MVKDNAFVGKWVKVDHPVTCLNPDEFFQVKEVRIEGSPMNFRVLVRGENTCWFGTYAILDWHNTNPALDK